AHDRATDTFAGVFLAVPGFRVSCLDRTWAICRRVFLDHCRATGPCGTHPDAGTTLAMGESDRDTGVNTDGATHDGHSWCCRGGAHRGCQQPTWRIVAHRSGVYSV